ncbi:hypothetical protein DFH06DRAFT_1020351, partial [Mycena polygramma]
AHTPPPAPPSPPPVSPPARASPTPPPTPPSEADWKPWFKHGFEEVSREELGGLYHEVLEALIDLERSYGFVFGTEKVKGVGRPSQVTEWIRDGRGRTQAVRAVPDVPKFSREWWTWWSSLQPEWRGSWRGRATQPPPPENAVWEKLRVPGQNGVLSVVATLYWWGCAEKGLGMATRSADWEEAATDTLWALRALKRSRPVV